MAELNLRDFVERRAEEWIAWAGFEGADHFFWRFSLTLLDLVPTPGRLTLNVAATAAVGAGAARLRPHPLLAIEGSPQALVRRRTPTAGSKCCTRTWRGCRWAPRSPTWRICSMAWTDFDDLDGTLRGRARVRSGGRLRVEFLHRLTRSRW